MAPLQVPNGSFSQFGPIWRPMALPYGHSGPGKWSRHIILDVPSPDPTLIHTDPPVWSHQGGVWPQKGNLWPFWRHMAPSDGHSGPGKRSPHITLDVSYPDPTLIHTDPPVCSRQGDIWPQKGHLWHFWAISAPYGAPLWPFRIRKMVPTHHPGCAQP